MITLRTGLLFFLLLVPWISAWAQSPPSVTARKVLNAALVKAVKQANVSEAERLLDQGADPNAQEIIRPAPRADDPPGGAKLFPAHTVLTLASENGSRTMVELLLRKGADINARGGYDYTPLMGAINHHQEEIARFLLEQGANPDSGMGMAVNRRETKLVALMLDKGANINGREGTTPLMDAVEAYSAEIVELLIKRGADVNLRREGTTALEMALLREEEEIIALLKKAGAKARPLHLLKREAQARSREWDKEFQKERAQRHKNALRWSKERHLTAEDRQVLEIVLLDMLAYNGKDLFWVGKGHHVIVLMRRTGGSFSDDQINADLEEEQAFEVTTAMRQSLQRRNVEPISLAHFKPIDRRIVASSLSEGRLWGGFEKRYSQARCWVETCLPGYAPDKQSAVVRFWFGPTSHGASGTYLLVKKRNEWQVKWRRFTYYT